MIEIIPLFQIELLILTIIFGFLIYFYITDLITIKENEILVSSKEKNLFLKKLKKRILLEIKQDKHLLFWLSLIFGIFLILSVSLFPYILSKSSDSKIEKERLSKNLSSEDLKPLVEDYKKTNSVSSVVLSGSLFIYLILFSLSYISLKINKHTSLIESTKSLTFQELLISLSVHEPELSFLKNLEEKYGKSEDEKTNTALTKFIYNSLFPGKKRIL